jgi:hypothetical protein
MDPEMERPKQADGREVEELLEQLYVAQVENDEPEGRASLAVAEDEFTYTDMTPVPEFPSPVLPAVVIAGLLGAVLVIRRMREY